MNIISHILAILRMYNFINLIDYFYNVMFLLKLNIAELLMDLNALVLAILIMYNFTG